MPSITSFIPLLYLFIISDTVGASVGAYVLWGMRKNVPPAKYVGIVLSAIAVDQVCQFVGSLERHGVHIGTWFFVWWLIGRCVRTVSVWSLVLFLVRIPE